MADPWLADFSLIMDHFRLSRRSAQRCMRYLSERAYEMTTSFIIHDWSWQAALALGPCSKWTRPAVDRFAISRDSFPKMPFMDDDGNRSEMAVSRHRDLGPDWLSVNLNSSRVTRETVPSEASQIPVWRASVRAAARMLWPARLNNL